MKGLDAIIFENAMKLADFRDRRKRELVFSSTAEGRFPAVGELVLAFVDGEFMLGYYDGVSWKAPAKTVLWSELPEAPRE